MKQRERLVVSMVIAGVLCGPAAAQDDPADFGGEAPPPPPKTAPADAEAPVISGKDAHPEDGVELPFDPDGPWTMTTTEVAEEQTSRPWVTGIVAGLGGLFGPLGIAYGAVVTDLIYEGVGYQEVILGLAMPPLSLLIAISAVFLSLLAEDAGCGLFFIELLLNGGWHRQNFRPSTRAGADEEPLLKKEERRRKTDTSVEYEVRVAPDEEVVKARYPTFYRWKVPLWNITMMAIVPVGAALVMTILGGAVVVLASLATNFFVTAGPYADTVNTAVFVGTSVAALLVSSAVGGAMAGWITTWERRPE